VPVSHRSAVLAFFALFTASVSAFADSDGTSRHAEGLRIYSLPSDAMMPAIHKGDAVLVNEQAYMAEPPVRGDVVVYRCPANLEVTLIKRVVAVPFETVEIRHKKVLVNGNAIGEGYAIHTDESDLSEDEKPERRMRDSYGPVTLKAGEYFVLGDNRDASLDSRNHGPVMLGLIHGRAVRVRTADGAITNLK
jgi:signal peptidase I